MRRPREGAKLRLGYPYSVYKDHLLEKISSTPVLTRFISFYHDRSSLRPTNNGIVFSNIRVSEVDGVGDSSFFVSWPSAVLVILRTTALTPRLSHPQTYFVHPIFAGSLLFFVADLLLRALSGKVSIEDSFAKVDISD